MEAVAIGPLVFPMERLAAIAAVAVLLLSVWVLSRRMEATQAARLDRWAWRAVILGALAGRGVHVAQHWGSFAPEPWRILAFWQGGFSAQGALVAVGLVTLLELGRRNLPPLGRPIGLALGLSVATWAGVLFLKGPLYAPGPPAQVFTAIDGREISLADRDGRPAVVNLWATWCAPCRRELPMMGELAAAHPGIDVIFANQREAPQTVGLFLATEGLSLPNVVLDQDGLLGRHYAVLGLPTTLFLAPDGQVVERHVGEISREAFAAALARLEGLSPSPPRAPD
ncbi:MAG: prolipoprotein diacylglyceryl transferase family protein [Alkalilacustris sp.]